MAINTHIQGDCLYRATFPGRGTEEVFARSAQAAKERIAKAWGVRKNMHRAIVITLAQRADGSIVTEAKAA